MCYRGHFVPKRGVCGGLPESEAITSSTIALSTTMCASCSGFRPAHFGSALRFVPLGMHGATTREMAAARLAGGRNPTAREGTWPILSATGMPTAGWRKGQVLCPS